jgi:ATP-dependent helicase/nuclease subunit A
LRRVTRLREQKKDLTAASLGEGADSVTISSIHKSKGLEWPIVFVCETAKPHSFARNDMTEPTILHSELGFACVRRNPEKKRQFVTVPLAAVRTEAQRGFLSEELRVLYVAMTRAKERLYLTACVRDPQKRLDGAAALTDGRDTLPTAQVRAGKTFLDWLLPAFSLRHDLSALAESGEREGGLRVFAGEAAAPAAIVSTEEEKTPRVDETLLARLRTQTSYAYPHRQATELPAKIAVSEISHDDASRYFTTRPDFLSAEGLTGTKRGTAVHAYLQFCDFAAAKRDPAAELSRMRETGILTAPQADAVDLAQIERFFASPLGSRIFSADRVLREFRFMAPAAVSPAAAHYALPDGEATMLQGVADCILIEGDHAVLIDYKTDRVKDADQLVRRYRKQLVLYRDMLAGVLGVPVAACALYSFALGETIWVE